MSDGHRLYQRHDLAALQALRVAVEQDPANREAPGGLHLYTPKARKRLEAIAWAIYYHMKDTTQCQS